MLDQLLRREAAGIAQQCNILGVKALAGSLTVRVYNHKRYVKESL